MKIILNNSQLAILSEQNPDNEEMVATEPLIVNYKNIATDNFRIYFNKVSDVSREDIENSEQIILRSDGQKDYPINTNLLSFAYWESEFGPNLSISKKEGIEITPEELPSENTTINKLLYNNTFLYTEVGGGKPFRQTVKQAIKDVWSNTANWGVGDVPEGSSREPGVINFELACGTNDWSILNYFEGNTRVLRELLIIYSEEVSDVWNRDEFLQWIVDNKKRLFGKGEIVEVLADVNRITQCVGERRERLGEEWLEKWYEENGLDDIRIESGCPGDTLDRTCGQDMRVFRGNGSVDYYQIKPLKKDVYKSDRFPYEVESASLPNYGYPIDVNYLFISNPDSKNPKFIVFKNEGQKHRQGIYRGKIGFNNPPVQSPTELESNKYFSDNLKENKLKIKITEHQAEKLGKIDAEEKKNKNNVKGYGRKSSLVGGRGRRV